MHHYIFSILLNNFISSRKNKVAIVFYVHTKPWLLETQPKFTGRSIFNESIHHKMYTPYKAYIYTVGKTELELQHRNEL